MDFEEFNKDFEEFKKTARLGVVGAVIIALINFVLALAFLAASVWVVVYILQAMGVL